MNDYLSTFILNYTAVVYITLFLFISSILLNNYKVFYFKIFSNNNLIYILYWLVICTLIKVCIELFYIQNISQHMNIIDSKRYIIAWYYVFAVNIQLNIYGSMICLLCCITVLFVALLIGSKLLNNIQIKLYLVSFIFITVLITNTTNIFILYLGFEFLFLPTLVLLYKTNYLKTTRDSIKRLILWTLAGIFLILLCLGYLFAHYGSVLFIQLKNTPLSKYELICFYLALFFGFSVKIPIIPFHFWLLKIHIDAPVSLSMFLSGFLVKISLYCFYILHNIFRSICTDYAVLCWIIFSVIIASFSFYTLQDIKRLIAWVTIQEMSIMFLLIFMRNSSHLQILFFFIFFHGILSMFMFYTVDLVEQRYSTRELHKLSGICQQTPKLSNYLWIIILTFSSFPFSFKFLIELEFFGTIIELYSFALLYFFCVLNVVATLSVCKLFLGIIFGTAIYQNYTFDLLLNESQLLFFFVILAVFSFFFFYLVL